MIDYDTLVTGDLSLDLPLEGRHLIEASAGTGKTFAIAGLYARLIVERQLPVRKVLVITFTRAAAEELRERLRHRLALCVQWAKDPAADPAAPVPPLEDAKSALALAVVRRVRERGNESADALAARLHVALLDMDQAMIGTIDSFCQQALRTWSTYFDDAIEDAELDPDDGELLADFAADAWLRAAGAVDDGVALGSLRMLAGSPAKLAELLLDLVYFDGTIEPAPPAVPQVSAGLPDIEAARAALATAWREHGAQAVALFEEQLRAGHLYKRYTDDKLVALRDVAARLADAVIPEAEAIAPFALAALDAGTLKPHKPFPAQPAFAAIDAWLDVQAKREEVFRDHAAHTLHALVGQARDWLAHRKRDLRRISYADPLVWLEEGLVQGSRRDALVAAMRRQYEVALIDEFQDTNPRQFRIFQTLFGAGAGLFLIGDPKQAIYGFRGGDVYAYLDVAAQERRAGRDIRALAHNFRSSAGLLRAFDALFTRVEDPFAQRGIAFEPVAPGGKVADGMLQMDGAPVTSMNLWPVDKDAIGAKVDEQRQRLADLCAAQVAALVARGMLDGQLLRPREIAVLVNDNKEALLVRDALQARGVAAVCVQRRSVYASREAAELLQIFDALLMPSSLRLARGALATGLLGRRLSQLVDEGALLGDALPELDALRVAWMRHGLVAMVEHLAELHASRLLALADGERRLVNVLQLAEALAADARQLAGPQALRDRLAERIRDANGKDESEQLRLESDALRVQVVTLHLSKGLEYDVVLLPFAALMHVKSASQHELAEYHHDDGTPAARVLLHASGDCKGKRATPAALAEGDARARAQAEAFAERMRLLYVGLTRARHACWLSAGMGAVTGRLLADPQAVRDLAARHPDVICCRAVTPSGDDVVPRAMPAARTGARRFDAVIARDWWLHSFSQLAADEPDAVAMVSGARDERDAVPMAAAARGARDADNATASKVAAVAVPAWPRGPRYGNAVHAILEATDMPAWKQARDAPPVERELAAHALRRAGFEGEELARALAPTLQLVRQGVLTNVLPDMCLADLDPADRRAEMPFHFGMAGAAPNAFLECLHEHGYQGERQGFTHVHGRLRGMMTGVIDLVFRHGGKWWIVDYKTNLLGTTRDDYAPARLPEAIAAHDYDLQYLIYTIALHRWLGHTLGAAWDYERDFGGVRYLFLRGMHPDAPERCGIHAARPPAALVQAADALLRAPGEAP